MRIFGVETEFGLTATVRSGLRPSADEAARLLFRPLTDAHKATNIFLRNGSRLYLDVGSHPEYATCECTTLTELLAHDRAGEEQLRDMALAGTTLLREHGTDGELVLIKNNTDSYGNSYGCHENYLVSRIADFDAFAAQLLPFLVTRQLLCGAGTLQREPDGTTRYLLSQRARHMLSAVSSATTRARPMINTRDEPHADPRYWRRLHVIVGDSSMAESTMWLKIGSMELVLRLLERGAVGLDALTLADPTEAIVAAATDRFGQASIRLASGDQITVLDLQRRYLEAVSKLDDLDEELRSVVELWTLVLDSIAVRNLDPLAADIDWVAKLLLLQRFSERHDLSLDDPQLASLDIAYHQLDSGIARMMERSGALTRITSPAEVARAAEKAPSTTRARLRGAVVAAAEETGHNVVVDWASVACPAWGEPIALLDPFATADARVDALIETMHTHPAPAPVALADSTDLF